MAEHLDGIDGGDKTALGFGGKTISRKLEIGDELYLLLHCEVVSDGRKVKGGEEDGILFSAGAKTEILAELSASEATKIAADHG